MQADDPGALPGPSETPQRAPASARVSNATPRHSTRNTTSYVNSGRFARTPSSGPTPQDVARYPDPGLPCFYRGLAMNLPWREHLVLPSLWRAINAVAAAAANNEVSIREQTLDEEHLRLDERNVSRRTTRSTASGQGVGSVQPTNHQPTIQRRRRRRAGSDVERLWFHHDGNSLQSADAVLDAIGSVLEERARQLPTSAASSSSSDGRMNPPHRTFLYPLLHPRPSFSPFFHPQNAECMRYDIGLVQSSDNLNIDGQGYIQVYLAYDRRAAVSRESAPIREGAHRIVLWSVVGPPSSDNYVAMHSCNNTRCLNPLHLAWGTRQENFVDGRRGGDTAAEAMRRILERMGASTSSTHQNASIDLQ